MGSKRRTFLQRTGLGLLTLGMSNTGWPIGALPRYYRALAEPTVRKLALLVGINTYLQSKNLNGCVTDVELQKELLIHRFGFNESDILTLSDRQATRENIETAFVEHLIAQAKASDVVVFHFSGYGARVKIPQSPTTPEGGSQKSYQSIDSLVPTDEVVTVDGTQIANNLSKETLELVARSLATDKLTFVLDTAYQSGGELLKGNLRIRSLPNNLEGLSNEELAFQERLRQRGQLSKRTGVELLAAKKGQVAAEGIWNGFSAGLFTYSLTQYLWQVAPPSTVRIAIARAAEMVESVMGKQQQPQLEGNARQPLLIYNLVPSEPFGAEGVVIAKEDNTAQIFLSGLPAKVVEYYGTNSCFSLVPPSDNEAVVRGSEATSNNSFAELKLVKNNPPDVFLQVRSKEGLTAKTKLINRGGSETYSLQTGQLVQELIRVLPRNIGLNVSLDANLERIERVDATSAFATISSVTSVVTAGEQAADYLFGITKKASLASADSKNLGTEPPREDGKSTSKGVGGYGLFSIGGVLIPETVGTASEAVKSAVRRLVPQLETLLAAKLWRLSVNEGSSKLGIKATLEIIDRNDRTPIEKETLRRLPGFEEGLSGQLKEDLLPVVASGSQIQYRIENQSDRPVYLILVGIDSDGSALALYSPELTEPKDSDNGQARLKERVIASKQTAIVPDPEASLNWIVSGPAGIARVQIVCSCEPFSKTLAALSNTQHTKGDKEQVIDLPNPLEVARALLEDLHLASAVPAEFIGSASDIYALDINAWANLSFVYEVV